MTEFKMPRGLHEGKTFDEIAKLDRGVEYIHWLAEQAAGEVYGVVVEEARAWIAGRETAIVPPPEKDKG